MRVMVSWRSLVAHIFFGLADTRLLDSKRLYLTPSVSSVTLQRESVTGKWLSSECVGRMPKPVSSTENKPKSSPAFYPKFGSFPHELWTLRPCFGLTWIWWSYTPVSMTLMIPEIISVDVDWPGTYTSVLTGYTYCLRVSGWGNLFSLNKKTHGESGFLKSMALRSVSINSEY